tara:strand:+ start:254 stop:628 length:375 start_codon:yes stop_codon:yes gene_type:complete
MKFQKKKNNFNLLNSVCLLCFSPLFIGCEDLFLRFKYETYECPKNYFKLKNVFIKNYELGDLVDVEIDDDGYKLEIKENSDNLMVLEREDPFISIRIEKKLSKLNVNFKNHIQNIKCKKHVFKM